MSPLQWVYAAIAVLVLAALGYGGWEQYSKAQAVDALEDYKQSAALTLAQRDRDNAARLAAAERNNADILQNLRTQLDRSRAAGAELARRLSAALAHDSGAVSQDPGQPGAAQAGGAAGNDALTAAAGDAFAECERNADRYDALILQLTPQL